MKTVAIIFAILVAIAAVILALNGVQNSGPQEAPGPAEIIVLSSALERYKTDHGHYPTDPGSTELLKPNAAYDAAAYEATSAFLYRVLWSVDETDPANRIRYVPDFPAKWLRADKNGVVHIVDPRGNYIGYSTFKAVHPESSGGINPTFDLWSTGGDQKQADQRKWIRNW